MTSSFQKWVVTFGALALTGVAIVAAYSYATYRPLSRGDFTAVEGTVHSTYEGLWSETEYLEIYLENQSIRFRVSTTYYREAFKKEEFRRKVHPGSPIVLEVETTELRDPVIPRDTKPTVFISGVHDASTVYYSLDDSLDWLESNHQSSRRIGVEAIAAAVFLVLMRKYLSFRERHESSRMNGTPRW